MTVQTYRGIRFTACTPTGYAMFEEHLPARALHWAHWSRFSTPAEAAQLAPGSTATLAERETAMRRAIDRAFDNAPCWRGDIRDQP